MLKTLAVILVSVGFAQTVMAADADVIREAKDRADIEVLIWRYVQALDNLDADAYPTFFTEDGQICCEHDHVYKGHAELRKLIQEVKDSRAAAQAKGQVVPKTYHPIFNSHIEFRDKDHAHIDSYWFTVRADRPMGTRRYRWWAGARMRSCA